MCIGIICLVSVDLCVCLALLVHLFLFISQCSRTVLTATWWQAHWGPLLPDQDCLRVLLMVKRNWEFVNLKKRYSPGFQSGPAFTTSGTIAAPGPVDEQIEDEERRGCERVYVCVREKERDTARGESWTTHPEDSKAQDSQPILLTCHTAPALGKALPNCSGC